MVRPTVVSILSQGKMLNVQSLIDVYLYNREKISTRFYSCSGSLYNQGFMSDRFSLLKPVVNVRPLLTRHPR